MRLDRVTVTGADDSIDAESLVGLAMEYPFVEFGILMDGKRTLSEGIARFPSAEWLHDLMRTYYSTRDRLGKAGGLNLSAHLCGEIVGDVLHGNWGWENEGWVDPNIFRRVQLNTHGNPHLFDSKKMKEGIIARAQEVIIQYDVVNERIFKGCEDLPNVATLFDISHGKGELPTSWPPPFPGTYCGYAGGLSPENVSDQIQIISSLCPSEEAMFWIDSESLIRNFDEVTESSYFDLYRVARFLEAAKPFVVESKRGV